MTLELQHLETWLGSPLRNPGQLNKLGQADCEIVALADGTFLCTTVDMIGEEVRLGLYKDYYTIGWVSALSAVSDLAACGAKPMGLLLAVQWPKELDINSKQRFMRGFNEFSRQLDVPLLGGDYGSADSLSVSVTGIGLTKTPILRSGIRDGDLLVLMAKIGYGPIMGIAALLNKALVEDNYRPKPIHAANYPSNYTEVHAGIDLSDGLLNAILVLSEVNQIKFRLTWNHNLIEEAALGFCDQEGLPRFLSWIGEHGDYQQLFAMPEASVNELRKRNIEHYIVGVADQTLKQTTLACADQILIPDLSWGQISATMSFAEMTAALPTFCSELRRLGFP